MLKDFDFLLFFKKYSVSIQLSSDKCPHKFIADALLSLIL